MSCDPTPRAQPDVPGQPDSVPVLLALVGLSHAHPGGSLQTLKQSQIYTPGTQTPCPGTTGLLSTPRHCQLRQDCRSRLWGAAAAFTDVTLVLQDEQPPVAHNVIVSATKPFFRNILKKNNHHHPLREGFQKKRRKV